MKVICSNIEWETDGENINLPKEVTLGIRREEQQFLADKLSDKFGWLVNSFTIKEVSKL